MKLINYYQQGNTIDPEANPFLQREGQTNLPKLQMNTFGQSQSQPQLQPRTTTVPTATKTFGQQFQEARQIAQAGGPKTFMWKGKEIGTQLQTEVGGTQQLKNKVQQNQIKSKTNSVQQKLNQPQTQQGTARVVPQISNTPEGKMLNNIIGYREPLKQNQNTVLPKQVPAQGKPTMLSGPTVTAKQGVVNPKNPVKLQGPTVIGKKKQATQPVQQNKPAQLAKFTPGPNFKPYQEKPLPQLKPNIKSGFETQVNNNLFANK